MGTAAEGRTDRGMGQNGTGELLAVWAEFSITPCYGFMHPPARLEPWEIIL